MAAAVVIGLQLVQLAFLTKWLGVVSGIVPMPTWLVKMSPYLKVENGLIVGTLLLTFGFVWSVNLVLGWGRTGFGPLQPSQMMRLAIPAVTLMMVGAQAAAGALFAGALSFCWKSMIQRASND